MDSSTKRRREEEDEQDQYEGRIEHKKARNLPFRTSPTTRHLLLFSLSPRHQSEPNLPNTHPPDTLTPADSSDEETSPTSHGAAHISHTTPSSTSRRTRMNSLPLLRINQALSHDSDVEMMVDSPIEAPLPSPPWQSGPASASRRDMPPPPLPNLTRHVSFPLTPIPQASKRLSLHPYSIQTAHTPSNNIETRLPTPVYGHFALTDAALTAPPTTRQQTSKMFPPSLTSRSLFPTPHHQTRRNLPSPISEVENLDSPTATTGKLFNMLNLHRSSLASPRTGMPSPPSSGFRLDIDQQQQQQQQISYDDMPQTPRTPMKIDYPELSTPGILGGTSGRPRRGAVSNHVGSPGFSPGGTEKGKVVLSMGYRADCEKCRERVPGHYSHVLRT
ncbi:hypothetical protein MMC25_000259 [Agyrium rufum]|nr:hypothetical protein [Agyrium rufum]